MHESVKTSAKDDVPTGQRLGAKLQYEPEKVTQLQENESIDSDI